jgi:hypothetical protein
MQCLANVKDGVFQGTHGVVGKPVSWMARDTITAEGEAKISVTALIGASATTLGHPPPGTKYSFEIVAKFDGTRRTGDRCGG